jgi:hypothetical protein
MKTLKIIACILIFAFLSVQMISCNLSEQPIHKYKRIKISGGTLDSEDSALNKTVSKATKVEYNAKEAFATTVPIYEINRRIVTDDELLQFAEIMGVNGELKKYGAKTYMDTDTHVLNVIDNSLYYHRNDYAKNEMTKSDEDLIREAKAIAEKLTILKGEYECVGVVSTQRLEDSEKGDIVVSKRIAFRKLIDGNRIIGNEICDFYFCSDGLYSISLELYDYSAVGEMELIPLNKAKEKIKTPDAFSITSDNGNDALSEKADTLCVERVKLLYVNQYTQGCTIIQPVYNFIGTAATANESVSFSSRIIAVPEKYTYVE